jgi:hypothetical protein
MQFPDERTATLEMLRTLAGLETQEAAIEYAAAGEPFRRVEEIMQEHDPLIDFSMTAHCPSCQKATSCPIDLESHSLRRLTQAQWKLICSVHCLAANYHWSEQQVFAVPYWRRASYLSLIAKGRNQ